MTTVPGSSPITTPTFGRVGYDAYGDHPSAHGPWTTFDGRPMPKWEEYSAAGPGSSGAFTQERWERAAAAIIAEHERRKTGDINTAVDYPAVAQRLALNGYVTSPRGPQGGLRVDVRHGEDPGRWTEVAESVLVTLSKGGPDAVAMALHLMMGGPRGGRAERLLAEAEQRDASGKPATSLGQYKISIDSSEAEAAVARLNAEVERLASALATATEGLDKLDVPNQPQEPTATLTLTAWTPESGVALVNLAQARAAGVPMADTINASEGRIDPFIMGIAEIASATRDLAEAAHAAENMRADHPVQELIDGVTDALHSRVKVLASQPSEPDAQA